MAKSDGALNSRPAPAKRSPAMSDDELNSLLGHARQPPAIPGCMPEGMEIPEGVYLKPGAFALPPSGWRPELDQRGGGVAGKRDGGE